jgi:putative peptidoglycan lipid II flippase
MRQIILQVLAVTVLLTILTVLMLWLGGRPLIRLFFRHGAFKQHAVVLTNLALLGYAVGIPGVVAGELFTRGFVALKDTKTPLFANILGLGIRCGLIVLFLHLFSKQSVILAIPLSVAVSMTTEALFLSLLLFRRLAKKVKEDKGIQRLQRRRLYVKEQHEKQQAIPSDALANLSKDCC